MFVEKFGCKLVGLMSKVKKAFYFSIISILILSTLVLWGFQSYWYLKNGVWGSISFIDGLAYCELSWAKKPEDWLGLWELFQKLPLAAFFIAVSIWVFHNYDKELVSLKAKT